MKPREAMQQELLLTAIALLAAAVLAWWFGPRKTQRLAPQAQRPDPKKAQRIDPTKAQREFLHRLVQGVEPGHQKPPRQKAQRQKAPKFGPRIEHEFNRLFMTTSKEGKEALIRRWMARQKCGRPEAMRLAIEEWRRQNR